MTAAGTSGADGAFLKACNEREKVKVFAEDLGTESMNVLDYDEAGEETLAVGRFAGSQSTGTNSKELDSAAGRSKSLEGLHVEKLIERMDCDVKSRLDAIDKKLENISSQVEAGWRGQRYMSENSSAFVKCSTADKQRLSKRSIFSNENVIPIMHIGGDADEGCGSMRPDLMTIRTGEPLAVPSPEKISLTKERDSCKAEVNRLTVPKAHGQPSRAPSQAGEQPMAIRLSQQETPVARAQSMTSAQSFMSRKSWATAPSIKSAFDALRNPNKVNGMDHLPDEVANRAVVLFSRRPRHDQRSVRLWVFLEDPESSLGAKLYDTIMPYFIGLTVLFSLMQSIYGIPLRTHSITCAIVETVLDVVFALEIVLRFVVCPQRSRFFSSPFNGIDLIATSTLVMRSIIILTVDYEEDPAPYDGLLCLVPMLRLLKMMRRFQKIHLLLGAFELAFEALPVLLYTLASIALFFASLLYFVEPRDNIETFPKAIYLTVVTMTTVGYGDVYPITSGGATIATFLVITSVLYMAMPLGIVGHAFTQIWQDRDRILLVKKTRASLAQWGYTAQDIPLLCQIFDTAGNGELNLTDFRRMIHQMRIGLKDERVIDLFQSFDQDGSGSIDDEELVRHLFPGAYHEMFGEKTNNVRVLHNKVCAQCGNHLMSDAQFCRKCGTKVKEKEEDDEEEEDNGAREAGEPESVNTSRRESMKNKRKSVGEGSSNPPATARKKSVNRRTSVSDSALKLPTKPVNVAALPDASNCAVWADIEAAVENYKQKRATTHQADGSAEQVEKKRNSLAPAPKNGAPVGWMGPQDSRDVPEPESHPANMDIEVTQCTDISDDGDDKGSSDNSEPRPQKMASTTQRLRRSLTDGADTWAEKVKGIMPGGRNR